MQPSPEQSISILLNQLIVHVENKNLTLNF